MRLSYKITLYATNSVYVYRARHELPEMLDNVQIEQNCLKPVKMVIDAT